MASIVMALGFVLVLDSLSRDTILELNQSHQAPPCDPIGTLIGQKHLPTLLRDIEWRIKRCIKKSVPPFARKDMRKLKIQISLESIEDEKEIRILPLKLQFHSDRLGVP